MTAELDRITVRTMRAEEFAAMRAVSVDAFGNDESIGELLDALRDSWAWHDELAFVAVRESDDGEEIVGQVLYTTATLDTPRRLVDVLVLSPVGVRTDLHGRGIGSRMINESLAVLAGRDEPLVFLEGSPNYYPRFGFRPAGRLGMIKPSQRIPDAAFMAIPLDGFEEWMTGTLVYPDPFWRTDSVGLR